LSVEEKLVVIRLNREIVFVVSLLILAVASTSMPAVNAQARLGKIILDLTHALPGTLVSFEGEGWGLPTNDPTQIPCFINGEPVKIDRHLTCGIGVSKGANEPFGRFTVKDVPAGTYSVFVTVTMYTRGGLAFNLTGETPFTVDAATAPIPEFPLPVLVLLSSLIVTYAISTRRRAKAAS
jgi:hypothetical protein